MSRLILTALLTLLTLAPCTNAKEVNGVELPDAISSTGLTLNGAGIRKKLFMKLYVGSLYLKQSNSDASAIISADEPMAIRLDITSELITAKKMEKATREGFGSSTGGDTSAVSSEIEQFLSVFRSGVTEGDSFVMIYQPGEGTAISKNGTNAATIKGLAFKQALFGIWLSNNPVQENLKASMLGSH